MASRPDGKEFTECSSELARFQSIEGSSEPTRFPSSRLARSIAALAKRARSLANGIAIWPPVASVKRAKWPAAISSVTKSEEADGEVGSDRRRTKKGYNGVHRDINGKSRSVVSGRSQYEKTVGETYKTEQFASSGTNLVMTMTSPGNFGCHRGRFGRLVLEGMILVELCFGQVPWEGQKSMQTQHQAKVGELCRKSLR